MVRQQHEEVWARSSPNERQEVHHQKERIDRAEQYLVNEELWSRDLKLWRAEERHRPWGPADFLWSVDHRRLRPYCLSEAMHGGHYNCKSGPCFVAWQFDRCVEQTREDYAWWGAEVSPSLLKQHVDTDHLLELEAVLNVLQLWSVT